MLNISTILSYTGSNIITDAISTKFPNNSWQLEYLNGPELSSIDIMGLVTCNWSVGVKLAFLMDTDFDEEEVSELLQDRFSKCCLG